MIRGLPEQRPVAPTALTILSLRCAQGQGLVAQAKFRDQCAVTVRAVAAQIGQQATALADHLQQSAARVQVVLMYFEMFGQLIDTPGEYRDLHLGRTGIGFMNASVCNDARFFFGW